MNPRLIGLVVAIAICLVAALAAFPWRVQAQLVADLSRHLVAITTGFTGTNVLLFGTTDGQGDVVVVVRGPENTEIVRRKGRTAGIWINEAEMTFDNVPSYYALAASGDLDAIVSDFVAYTNEIGADRLRLRAPKGADPSDVASFRDGLIRNKERANLYSVRPQPIVFLGNRLFRTDLHFPATAPVGPYVVQVFLLEDGDIIGAEITPLVVSKVGFEAGLFDFAHRHPAAYGLLAIAVAVVAGWGASVVFRKG